MQWNTSREKYISNDPYWLMGCYGIAWTSTVIKRGLDSLIYFVRCKYPLSIWYILHFQALCRVNNGIRHFNEAEHQKQPIKPSWIIPALCSITRKRPLATPTSDRLGTIPFRMPRRVACLRRLTNQRALWSLDAWITSRKAPLSCGTPRSFQYIFSIGHIYPLKRLCLLLPSSFVSLMVGAPIV